MQIEKLLHFISRNNLNGEDLTVKIWIWKTLIGISFIEIFFAEADEWSKFSKFTLI